MILQNPKNPRGGLRYLHELYMEITPVFGQRVSKFISMKEHRNVWTVKSEMHVRISQKVSVVTNACLIYM